MRKAKIVLTFPLILLCVYHIGIKSNISFYLKGKVLQVGGSKPLEVLRPVGSGLLLSISL